MFSTASFTMKASLIFGLIIFMMRNSSPAPTPGAQTADLIASLQTSISSLLAQIQTAQTSKSLAADRTTSTALSQLQTVVTNIQTTFNSFVSNGLANFPAALTGGLNSIMTGVQSVLNSAGNQLGQLISAGNSSSSSLMVDQLNMASSNLSSASTSWMTHVGNLLNQLSGVLSGIVDRLAGFPAALNGLFG